MVRRVLAVVVLCVLVGACSGGDDDSTPTTLPPTTRPPTPIAPTGAADVVRRWVGALEGRSDDVAFGLLGPQTQAAIGGRDGYPRARRDLDRRWRPWATTPSTTFDALPVDDGLAVVVVHARDEDGGRRADAVPVVPVGDDWRVEPLLDTGTYRAVPTPGSEIAPNPDLGVEVDDGVEVTAFVDTQPALESEPSGGRVSYVPETGLRPGSHIVTLVFRRGDAVTARTTLYEVVDQG